MKYFFVLFFMSLTLNLNAFEFEGLCDEPNTALSCTVVNKTGQNVRHIEWLLEGNWADFGNDVSVNLRDGESTIISNQEGPNNCFFTDHTWLVVRTDSDRRDYYDDGTISFDSEGHCTITLK